VLTALNWSRSTEAGLEGQSFSMDATCWVLSRTAFPAGNNSNWAGFYEMRRQGLAAIHGTDDFSQIVDVVSIEVARDDSGSTGVTTLDFNGSGTLIPLTDTDTGGVVGDEYPISPLGGMLYDEGGLTIIGSSLQWQLVAVQLSGNRLALVDTLFRVGTVNTGTTDQYFVLYRGWTRAGVATREAVQVAPSISRQPTDVAVLAGGDVYMSVEATGTPSPSYEWEQSTDAGLSWMTLIDSEGAGFTGVATATLTVDSASVVDGQKFRVRVSNPASFCRR